MNQKEENNEYLNQLRNKVGGTSSFQVPEGYFENLSQKIEAKIESDKSSIISTLHHKTSFQVPDDYFTSLKQKVENKTKKGRLISLFSYKSFAYAATIAILIGVSIFFFNQHTTNTSELSSEVNIKLLATNFSHSIEPFESVVVDDYFNTISTEEITLDAIDFDDESEEVIDVLVDIENVINDKEVLDILDDEITTDDIDLDIIDFSDDFELF